MSSASPIRRVVSAARSRLFAAELARCAGLGIACGALAGLTGVVAYKALREPALAGITLPWWVIAATASLAGAAIGSFIAHKRRPTLLASAQQLDATLKSKDTIASALEFEIAMAPSSLRPSQDPLFVAIAQLEAVQLAGRADPRSVAQIRWGRAWLFAPLAFAGAAAVGIFAPAGLWIPQRPATIAKSIEKNDALEAAKDLAKLREQATPADPIATPKDAAPSKQDDPLDELKRIEQELASGKKTASQARTEGAKAVEDLATRVERRSQEQQAQADAVRQKIAQAARSRRDDAGSPTSDLAKAMQNGDLAEAAAEAEKLLKDADNLTPQEREQAATELSKLADELRKQSGENAPPRADADVPGQQPQDKPGEKPADQTRTDEASKQPEAAPKDESTPQAQPPKPPELSEPVRRELQDKGVTPQEQKDLASKTDERQVADELQKKGVSPEESQRLAEKVTQENRERQAKEEASKKTEKLADTMQDAAKDLQKPPAPQAKPVPQAKPEPQPQPRQGDTAQSQPKPAQQKPDSTKNAPNQKPGEQPGAKSDQNKTQQNLAEQKQSDQRKGKEGEQTKSPSSQPQTDPKNGEAGKNPEASKDSSRDQPAPKQNAAPDKKDQQGTKQEQPSANGSKQDTQNSESKSDQKSDQKSDPKSDKPGEQSQPEGAKQPGDKPTEKPGASENPKEQSAKPGEKPAAGEPTDKPADKPSDKTGEQKQAGEKPVAKPGAKPGEQPGAKPEPKPGDATGPNGDKPQPGDKKPGGSKSAQPNPGPQADEQASDQAPDKQADRQADKQSGQPQPGQKSGPKTGQKTGQKPGQKAGDKSGEKQSGPDASQPSESQQPSTDPNAPKKDGGSGLERLRDQLKDLAGQGKNAQKDKQTADNLREKAREMLDKATPEERKKLLDMAQQFAKDNQRNTPPGSRPPTQQGTPPDQPGTDGPRGNSDVPPSSLESKPAQDTLDLRKNASKNASRDDRVIAEWLGQRDKGAPGIDTDPADAARVLQRAAESAQRAVDDRLVPSRYDRLIERVYRVLPKALGIPEKK